MKATQRRQLSVRGVDPRLSRALDRECRRRGLSLNRCVLQILQEGLGLAPASGAITGPFDDLDSLAGTWGLEEARRFEEALKKQRSIDEGMWE